MYSFRPFPEELRTTFELPDWPHWPRDSEQFATFRNYMQKLTVFHYDDSDIDPRSGKDTNPIFFDFERGENFFPYKEPIFLNGVHVSSNELKVFEWPRDEHSHLMDKIKNKSKYDDMMAWRYWNVPCIFQGLVGGHVKRKIMHDKLNPDMKVPFKNYRSSMGFNKK